MVMFMFMPPIGEGVLVIAGAGVWAGATVGAGGVFLRSLKLLHSLAAPYPLGAAIALEQNCAHGPQPSICISTHVRDIASAVEVSTE